MKAVPYNDSMKIVADYLFAIDQSEQLAQAKRGDANAGFHLVAGQPYPRLDFTVATSNTSAVPGSPIQGMPISVQPHKGWMSWLFTPMRAGFGSSVPPAIVVLNGQNGLPLVTDENGRGSAIFTFIGAGYANVDLVVGDARMAIPCVVYPDTVYPATAASAPAIFRPTATAPTGVEQKMPGH